MPKKQSLILSLTLFLIYSCANDNSSDPSPASIVGTWSSGDLSYHQAENCLNEGQNLEDFVNAAISNNIEIEAQNTAALACVDESEYETCLADFIELYSNNFDNADSLLFSDLISSTFLYNSMTLIINNGFSYETQYNGSCIYFNIFGQGACELFDGAEWIEESEECIFLTENACVEIGSGTWNDGWVGDWEEMETTILYIILIMTRKQQRPLSLMEIVSSLFCLALIINVCAIPLLHRNPQLIVSMSMIASGLRVTASV